LSNQIITKFNFFIMINNIFNYFLTLLRFSYSGITNFLYREIGIKRRVNGLSYRALPQFRWYFTSSFDESVANYFRTRIRKGDLCISVGANLGLYPLQFAKWSGSGSRIIAFEPNPKAVRILHRHLSINGVSSQVDVVEAAVADKADKAMFHAVGVDGMSRLGNPNPGLLGKTTALEVNTVSLDNYCSIYNTNFSSLMIDVEGFEILVLRGARNILRRARAVVVELHPNAWSVAGTNRDDLVQFLNDESLCLVPLSGQIDPYVEYGHVALERWNS